MPNFTLTTSGIQAASWANMGTDNNAYTLVAPNVLVGTSGVGGNAILGSANYQSVEVQGAVWTASSNTIFLAGAWGRVSVADTGRVSNMDRTYSAAINIGSSAGNSAVMNAGEISGGSGVYSAHGLNLTNTGLIQSNGAGISTLDTGVTAGVLLFSSAIKASLIVNSGTISGSEMRSDSLHAGSRFAIYEMQSDTNIGHAVTVRNSGLLDGRVWLGAQNDTVFNTGLIEGQVNMGTGIDVVNNSGTINGDVYLDAGNDIFLGRGAGQVFGTVLGGAGLDDLTGGDLADRMLGEADADILNGRGGDDSLLGGSGADLLRGGNDDDLLDGGSEADRLRGGNGDDTLFGGNDADTLVGGAGDDILIGALGNDTLTGGAGADVFVFEQVADSGAFPNGDTITDFTRGQDLIDLADVVGGTLVFRGTGAFSGGGTASVKYVLGASGSATVQVDTNGDSLIDMRIILNNTSALGAADFIL